MKGMFTYIPLAEAFICKDLQLRNAIECEHTDEVKGVYSRAR